MSGPGFRFNKTKERQMLAIHAATRFLPHMVDCKPARRRGGRVAEGGGLLNRYTG